MEDLFTKLTSTTKVERHDILNTFKDFPSSPVPFPRSTFYIRPRNRSTVIEIARDTVDGKYHLDDNIQGGVQERAFIPWDRNQVWSFYPINDNTGILWHPESYYYLTARDQKLVMSQVYGQPMQEKDYFEYTKEGYWVHVESGLKLCYTTGCGCFCGSNCACGHEHLTTCYDFDIIPSIAFEKQLHKEDLYWGAVNQHDSLDLPPNKKSWFGFF